jgi:hypothetical protein
MSMPGELTDFLVEGSAAAVNTVGDALVSRLNIRHDAARLLSSMNLPP